MTKSNNYTTFEKHVLRTYDQLWQRLEECENMIERVDVSGGADAIHYDLLLRALKELIEQTTALTDETETTNQEILQKEADIYAKLDTIEERFKSLEKLFMFYADNAEAYKITTNMRSLIELDVFTKRDTPFSVNLTLTGLSSQATHLQVEFYINGSKTKNVIEPVISAHCFSIGIPLIDELREGKNSVQIKLKTAAGVLDIDAFCSRIMLCGVGIDNAEQMTTQKIAERITYQIQKCYCSIS